MSTYNSRLSRIEEKRTKKQLFWVTAGIIALIILVVTLGIPLVVQFTSLVGNIKSNQPLDAADKTAPFPPTLAPILESTNSAQLKIEGFAEPETTLKIYLNGEEDKKVLIGADGGFSFNDISLRDGPNTIYATATDQAGNESNKSKEFTVLFSKNAPKIEISEPTDNQEFGKNQQEIVVKGKTDKGVDIKINDRFVFVHDDGTFTYTLKLSEGENTLKVIGTDAAGNSTTLERKVIYKPN
jgi:hypothetical protein